MMINFSIASDIFFSHSQNSHERGAITAKTKSAVSQDSETIILLYTSFS